MQVRREGKSMLCPGCAERMAEARIARSLVEFRPRREPVCRVPVENLDETVFETSDGDCSDGRDSIWAGWLID